VKKNNKHTIIEKTIIENQLYKKR